MSRKRLALLLVGAFSLASLGVGLSIAAAPGDVVVNCATQTDVKTASVPPITYSDGGSRLGTIPGSSATATAVATACATVTTPTGTTPATTTAPTTTTQPTTTTSPPPPPPPSNCTATLAPGGNVASFVNNSANGNALCLHGGDYGGLSVETFLTRSGTAGTPLVLQSYPGERATLHGHLVIGANYVTLQNLDLDVANTVGSQPSCGSSVPGSSTLLAGTGIVIDHDNIFQSVRTTGGQTLGYNLFISSGNATISHNRIHDVGGCQGYDHGIYVGHGSGTKVFQNWIWNVSSGWGVQVYPDASNVNVHSNVIDAAGSGTVQCSSGSGNVFTNNVVSNSTGNSSGGVGSGALQSGCVQDSPSVTGNDQWANPGGFGNASSSSNVSVDPQYANRASHNFTVLNPSLAGYGLWDGN